MFAKRPGQFFSNEVDSRVQPLKQSDTGTVTGTCHFFVRLKPKHFPNRADLSRFLDRFDMLNARSVRGGALDDHAVKTAGHAPLLRHNSGEHHNGGAGTSI
jgi:hypothetical protein